MQLYHLENLYIGALVTYPIKSRKKPYITKEYSKKIILEKLVKDDETYFYSTLTATFVPAEYETKNIHNGMTYATEIEPLSKYYSEKLLLTREEVKSLEEKLNSKKPIDYKNSRIYENSNLFIGRIYHFTPNNDNWTHPSQNFSREFIFERILDSSGQIGYAEICSRVVYNELLDAPVVGESYVELIPLNKVFETRPILAEEELLILEKQLSSETINKQRKILSLKPIYSSMCE